VLCAYGIALGIALACAFIALAALGNLGVGSIIIGIGSGLCSAALLWSLIPRRDRFIAPGPILEPANQPRLFAEIAKIANEFQEPVPATAYLILEANAWVARRGGMLGVGGQRVMAVGLPLLSMMTIAEFRAVLAHEFAHYYGGDTALGIWLRTACEGIVRSIQGLSSESGLLNVMSRWAYVAILRWVIVTILGLYWKGFLRLTMLASRQWEYRADELACAVAGTGPLISGLGKIVNGGLAWPWFLGSEVVPVLNAGFCPPLADGFARFLSAPQIAALLPGIVQAQLTGKKPKPLDSHPTFQQRAERALRYAFPEPPEHNTPAIALLDGIPALEQAAFQAALPQTKVTELKPMDWEHTGDRVWVPYWRQCVREHHALLNTYRVADIPKALADAGSLAAKVPDPKGTLLTREQRRERAISLIWMAFLVILLDRGWALETRPGAMWLVQGERKVGSNNLLEQMKGRKTPGVQYDALIQELGIGAVPLASANV